MSSWSTALKLKALAAPVGAAVSGAAAVAAACVGLAIRVYAEKHLTVLHGLSVLGEHLANGAAVLGLDLVHDLHRLDDAEDLTLRHAIANGDIRLRPRLRCVVKGPHHRRLHFE